MKDPARSKCRGKFAGRTRRGLGTEFQGFNRGEHGRAVGVRTTILVCLAACLAMVEANLMLVTTGKTSSSFAQIDPLRFPLGILAGIGFIGAGAIIKKNDFVLGLTSGATIWFVTTIGLCLGGGQLGLGLAGFALALGTLWRLQQIEKRLPRSRRAWPRLPESENFLGRWRVTSWERVCISIHRSDRSSKSYTTYLLPTSASRNSPIDRRISLSICAWVLPICFSAVLLRSREWSPSSTIWRWLGTRICD